MKIKLRMYVENLFEGAPKSVEVIEIREEILQNVMERYEDLIRDGKSEDEAYSIAVSGIGDVNELLNSMGQPASELTMGEASNSDIYNGKSRGNVFLLSFSIVIYIMSLIPVIIADEIMGSRKAEGVAICIMFVMWAIATGMIVVYAMTKPKKNEVIQVKQEEKENPVYTSIKPAIWAVTTTVYLIVSFLTGAWHISWVIFLIGHAITEIVKACIEIK